MQGVKDTDRIFKYEKIWPRNAARFTAAARIDHHALCEKASWMVPSNSSRYLDILRKKQDIVVQYRYISTLILMYYSNINKTGAVL